jgi:hypothetical protein
MNKEEKNRIWGRTRIGGNRREEEKRGGRQEEIMKKMEKKEERKRKNESKFNFGVSCNLQLATFYSPTKMGFSLTTRV